MAVTCVLWTASCGQEDPLSPDAAPTIDAALDAAIEPAMLSLVPEAVAFGSVVAGGSSTPITITVTNVGQRPTGQIAAATTASSFTIDASTCGVLEPSATCAVTISFRPADPGSKTGLLELTSAPGGTVRSSLAGAAVAPGGLVITPSTSSFGVVEVGDSTPTTSFIVTNTGGLPTGALGTVMGGANPSEFIVPANTCFGALAPGDSCLIGIRFLPDFGGAKSATVSVIGEPGGTVTAAMTGTATAPAEVVVTPQSHDFGPVSVNTASAIVTFTATNVGGMTAPALTQSVSGPDPGQFTIVSSTCHGAVLAPSASCTLVIQFTPSLTGVKSAQINLWPGAAIHFHVNGIATSP